MNKMKLGALTLIALVAFTDLYASKLDYRQRQAMDRQERNMADIEKKIAAGEIKMNGSTGWLVNKLDAVTYDLNKNKVPRDNPRVSELMKRIEKARKAAGAKPEQAVNKPPQPPHKPAQAQQQTKTPVPKLAPNAKKAVNHQWSKLQQQKRALLALNDEVEKATSLKRWDDRGIKFKLQGVLEELDKYNIPKDHPYYVKIKKLRTNILTSLDNVKAKAEPKIAAYTSSVSLENYPDIKEDTKRADTLAHLYQNVNASDLENPDKAERLLGQFGQIPMFIKESRKKYAPLIKNKMGAGNTLETKLSWLEKNFEKFKTVQKQFSDSIPKKVDRLLKRAQNMSKQATSQKNPQFFTGGVRQSLDKASSLLESFTLARGDSDAEVKKLKAKLQEAEKEAAVTAKALESEIIASNRAPEHNFSGSNSSKFISQMRDEWKKKNPSDKILDVRIVSNDWERSSGYDWNSAYKRWEKFDKQWLKMAVIVQDDAKIATIYPAFINRDNMKKKESLVASHRSTYVIRKMLVKNLN